MALIKSTAIPSGATDFELEQSLKFNEARSPYLNRTPSSASNRKTFTYSCWMKIGNISNDNNLLHARESANDRFHFLMTSNYLGVSYYVGGTEKWIRTTPLLRDPSAWYHIVLRVDTTQSTSTDRVRIYVNGEVQHLYTGQMPTQNWDLAVNNNVEHRIGQRISNNDYKIDGYLAEIHLVDGASLAPTSFGETGTYGEWKPLEVDVTHGTNGFYLPFKQDYTVEGFSTVTYTGNDETSQYIGGVGFQPDLVWIKERSGTVWAHLFDSVRGVNKALIPHETTAENTTVVTFPAFNSDGFTVGDGNLNGETDATTASNVAWNWDMGGSNASNTNGSITSTVRANTTYGQSIVSYTGNNIAGATIGHGLSSQPDMIIVKKRAGGDAYNWGVWHTGLSNNNGTKQLWLNSDSAERSEDMFNNAIFPSNSSTVFAVGQNNHTNYPSGATYIAYCFHDVSGYSKFGSYSGSGSSGKVITTGFKPAFVMLKHSNAQDDWYMFDNTRSPTNPVTTFLKPNSSNAEGNIANGINFTDTGFTILDTGSGRNASGGEYIYAAFADKREYAYWLDQSGNNNDWTSNNLTESDISVDSPTNNFATWNPLSSIVLPTLSEGNLKSGGENNKAMAGTFGVSTGKWYWEINVLNNSQIVPSLGVTKFSMENDPDVSPTLAATSGRSTYRFRATPLYKNFTATAYANDSAHGLADYGILGLALDLDNGTLKYYVNNTLYHTDSTIPSDGTILYPLLTETYAGGSGWNTTVANFGQDSSFAGNKTAQGNQDGNSIGDFYYTPPTGYLALCTKNLPDVDVVPSEHFNTVLWTGNGTTGTNITNVGFAPSFTWLKGRDIGSDPHQLYDTVRGATKSLKSNATDAEITRSTGLTAFGTDGFTIGNHAYVNRNTSSYVAWNWKANGSGSSNTNGDITSTVSANVNAGFSLISYSGASNASTDNSNNGGSYWTIGHGLSKAPELILVKKRSSAAAWYMGHQSLSSTPWTSGSHLVLSTTNANANEANNILWGNSAPTSTVFEVGGWDVINRNGSTYIAYCFHSVDSYSKVGSYTGNGNVDGTFVYTGFRPAWVMWKKTNASGTIWQIFDSVRNTSNPVDNYVSPNSGGAESNYDFVDFTSNGFKHRHSSGHANGSGDTYIYLAFAETPFKNSNAR